MHVDFLGLRKVDVLGVRMSVLLDLLLNPSLGVPLLSLRHVPSLRWTLDLRT